MASFSNLNKPLGSMTFSTPHIGNSRHGLFFARLYYQSNTKPSEKDHDLPENRTRDLWSSSQHTQPLPPFRLSLYL
jgi:hypothetical protein